MSVFKRGQVWWYKFYFASRLIRESAKTSSKTLAKVAERRRRRDLEEGFNSISDDRSDRVKTIAEVAEEYLNEYVLRHRSSTFAEYAVGNVVRHLGGRMLVEVCDQTVQCYQTGRLKEGAAPKTINEEVGFLLRLLGDIGETIRGRLRRQRKLKLSAPQTVGRAFSESEKDALLDAARKARSPVIYPALMLALNAGMRDSEIRSLTWSQIDLERRFLTVGKSKTVAGEGRTIPLNDALQTALIDHARWYTARFGIVKPEWYIFPGRVNKPETGKKRPFDPTRPMTSLKTSWKNAKQEAGVTGRLHDARHTLITELAESGAGDQTIMDIAGHVSRQMLARYSHIRMEAKRKALAGVGTRKPLPAPDPVGPKDKAASVRHGTTEIDRSRAQKWAQSDDGSDPDLRN